MVQLLEVCTVVLTVCSMLLVVILVSASCAWAVWRLSTACDRLFDYFKCAKRFDGFQNSTIRVKSIAVASIVFSVAAFYTVTRINDLTGRSTARTEIENGHIANGAVGLNAAGQKSSADKVGWILQSQNQGAARRRASKL